MGLCVVFSVVFSVPVLGFFLTLGHGSAYVSAAKLDSYEMSTMCGRSLNMNWKSVYMAEVTFDPYGGGFYDNPVTSCDLGIVSWHHLDQIMIRFKRLNTGWNCSESHLQIIDGLSTSSPPLIGVPEVVCGQGIKKIRKNTYISSDREIKLRYTGPSNTPLKSGFTAVITAFHTGRCLSYEHECDNGRCIWGELVCNGQNPCGDNSDKDCVQHSDIVHVKVGQVTNTRDSDSQTLVTIIVSSAALLTLACVMVFIYFRWNRNRKRELERHNVPLAEQTTGMPTAIDEVDVTIATFRSPPSYNSLPVLATQQRRSLTTSSSFSSPSSDNEETVSLMMSTNKQSSSTHEPETDQAEDCECLQDDSSDNPPPPSYLCVMNHQEHFNISTPSVDRVT